MTPLYHGTAAVLLDSIQREGLVGPFGRVHLTDSLALARRYATWTAALVGAAPDRGRFPEWIGAQGNDRAALGAELDGDSGSAAVLKVHLPSAVALHTDPSTCPPLPWETTMPAGTAFYVANRVTRGAVSVVEVFDVEELALPGMLDNARREQAAIIEAFYTGAAFQDFHGCLLDAAVTLGLNATPLHGADHWRGVAAAGIRIIEAGCLADPAVVFAFSVLHDAYRMSEGHDPEHGARAAKLAEYLSDQDWFALDSYQKAVLEQALVDHDQGLTTDDPTIGACWDADRLTLPRVGITPDPQFLSTDAGRSLAVTPWRVPQPADSDWPWVIFRYQLAGHTYRERLALTQ